MKTEICPSVLKHVCKKMLKAGTGKFVETEMALEETIKERIAFFSSGFNDAVKCGEEPDEEDLFSFEIPDSVLSTLKSVFNFC